ncbi:hypothetical protein FA95DRAFT_1608346 [Auriscalpium vulgare]|uniref:Uncharacterized protein n=1 Tax=Auriscalpium vulgare TaxID=40419 RepID=A0ACB8RKD6_9AGAM|nr:hypothetical protein FA95DRAFT_1608346 [Auriscalpium vulgare]
MSVIPVDAQLIVIEWVYRVSQHSVVDYQTLRACALTCKAWTPVAQRLLFRRIYYTPIFRIIPAFEVERLLLTLSANPRLASYVCSIEIEIDTEVPHAAAKSLSLLGLCADVQHIYFDWHGSPSNFISTFDKQLRALPLSPVVSTLSADTSLVNHIASIWPSIHTLKMRCLKDFDEDEDEDVFEPTPIFVPSTVRSLSVDTDDTAWKFAPPDCDRSGLRALELKLPHDDAWVDLLVVAGVLPQLRFLGIDGPIPTQAALDRLTQLHTLVFTELPYNAASLPQSLRNLAYHARIYDEPEGWTENDKPILCMLEVLDQSTNLRRFTMPCGMSGRLREKFDEVCGNRGIEVITYTGMRNHERDVDVDWI